MRVENVVVSEAQATIEEVGMRLKFEDCEIKTGLSADEIEVETDIENDKNSALKGTKQMRIETCQSKDQQSRFF